MFRFTRAVCVVIVGCSSSMVLAQHDPVEKGATALHESSGGKLTLRLEERTRWEAKTGMNFGAGLNEEYMLSRLRIGMEYRPANWFTISALGQDTRAPFYGRPAPNTLRNTMDLHEAYIALGGSSNPVTFSFGRRMLNYGETRVIGVPQWANTSRTFDYGRAEYSNTRMTLDGLMLSPVIVRPDSFDNPELGGRIWGTYDVFQKLARGVSVDTYVLRHSQNKVGGWTGKETLGTNSFGMRIYGNLPAHFAYSLEGIGQTGKLGLLKQRAYAWFAGASRPVKLAGLMLDLSAEFKEASGSRSGSDHSATYDQLSPANHDKFGHEDLFGWRNLETFKFLATAKVTKRVDFNVMYTDHNLFSATDALYNAGGSKIAISSSGKAGTRVGQELDGFLTVKAGPHTFYAGFGHFFKGQFIEVATPGINPRYLYIAQQYALK